MKFRITYTDAYRNNQTIVVEEDSYWHAKTLGEKMFKQRFISCEDMNPPTEKYIADFDNDYIGV